MPSHLCTKLARILLVFALAGWFQPAGADDTMPAANLDDYQKFIAPLFAKSCADCHGPRKSEAGFRVDQLDPNLLTGRDVNRWVEVYDALSQSKMPPDDEPDYHLSEEDRVRIIEWLGKEMQKATEVRKNAGGHSFRSMNCRETPSEKCTKSEAHPIARSILKSTIFPPLEKKVMASL